MSQRRSLSCAETAKLIRKALKGKFPGQKFYVRSKTYSGGASITIKWIDGPTKDEVNPVVQLFSGADFDGMIDLKVYNDSWLLPDGSVEVASSSGTEGSGGFIPKIENPKPHPDAELVYFGANYIFTERSFSKEFLEKVAEEFSSKTGWDKVELVDSKMWVSDKNQIPSAYFGRTQATIPGGQHFQTLDREYNEAAHKTSAYVKPEVKESKVKSNGSGIWGKDLDWNKDGWIVFHEGDWTWILFKDTPSEDVRDALKSVLKARWASKRGAWYVRRWVGREEIATAIRNAQLETA